MQKVRIERVEIPVEDSALKGVRILHLSDLHLSTRHSPADLERLIRRINGVEADFIALTGDLIDTSAGRISPLLSALEGIEAPTFFVSGNHDHVYGYRRLLRCLESAGIHLLDGRTADLEIRGRTITLAGLPDRFAPFFGFSRDPVSLIESLKGRANPVIFLAHQPKDYRHAQEAGSTLFLCGHTHGGQIWPFHWLVRLSQPFLQGLHRVGKMSIYVSRGVGTWGIHRRFRAPAEMPLLCMI